MKLLRSELSCKLSLARLNPDVVMTPAEQANPFCRMSIEAQLVGDDELTPTARSLVKPQKRQADEPADALAHEQADAGPSQLPESRTGKRTTRSNGEVELGSSGDSQRSLFGKSAPW